MSPVRIVIAATCVMALLSSSVQNVDARPQYGKAVDAAYPDVAKKHGKNGKVSCAMCHPTKSKKERNNYGAALAEALGAKNVKDAAAITTALKKIESSDSATAGN